MINIREGELLDLLPSLFSRQPEVKALSYALQQATVAFFDALDGAKVYAFIDGAGDAVLDLLAVELMVKYYDTSLDIEAKRNLVKVAMLTSSKDGTKYAVEEVVGTLFGEGKVLEWFEYGGSNNHFRIDLDSKAGYDVEPLLGVLDNVKRLSSQLDGIRLLTGIDGEMYAGALVMERYSFTIGAVQPSESTDRLTDEGGNVLLDELDNVLVG